MCVVCLYFSPTSQPKQTVTSGMTWWCSCKPGGANRKQDCTGIKNTSSNFYYRKTGNIWKRQSRIQKVAMSLFVKTLLKHYSNFHYIRENKGVDIGFFSSIGRRKENLKFEMLPEASWKKKNKLGEIKLFYQKDFFFSSGKETSLNTLTTLSKEDVSMLYRSYSLFYHVSCFYGIMRKV